MLYYFKFLKYEPMKYLNLMKYLEHKLNYWNVMQVQFFLNP